MRNSSCCLCGRSAWRMPGRDEERNSSEAFYGDANTLFIYLCVRMTRNFGGV